ncbi:MAG: cell division topological specificity factor MinE [Clostridiales bacterium]|jgi:cell division topological specificity factor|nr:cell division topological specificity factor MinE [Clostridiales bacterium]
MFFNSRKQKSGEIAKNRLQLVIYQDRMNTNPELVDRLRYDILQVIKSYIDIDEGALDIKISSPRGAALGEDGPALEVNIPIKGWKMR